MRNDIPNMNPGKGMAQASHATSSFEYWSRQRYARENFGDSIDRWRGETGYFGTTIVLEGSKEEIQKLFADFCGDRRDQLARHGPDSARADH